VEWVDRTMDNNTSWSTTTLQLHVHLFEEFVNINYYLCIKVVFQSPTRVTNCLEKTPKVVVVAMAKFK
jgi:hypothetical protein